MPVRVDERCRYAKSHEWVRVEGEFGFIGITDYAQSELGDIVYVELPEVGDSFTKGEVFGVVESVKAASDLYMPIAGEIVEINRELEDQPELANKDAYGDGWFIKIAIEDEDELNTLMDAARYQRFVERVQTEGDR